MSILKDIEELHDSWDAKGGKSGNDMYEDALYDCVNELGDVINKYKMQEISEDAIDHFYHLNKECKKNG